MRLPVIPTLLWLLALPSVGTGQTVSWPADPPSHQLTSDRRQAPQCGSATPSITASSLGPISVGMALRDVRSRCPQLLYAWLILEGDPEPVAVVRFGSVEALLEFADTLPTTPVYRISTRSAAARTADSVGPGTPVAELARRLGPLEFALGEGRLFAIPREHAGYSFELLVPGEWDWDRILRVQRTGDLRLLPAGTRVAAIVIIGP